jgi:valine dehydrogenase (NAD+)
MRFYPYGSEGAALTDSLRLSEAMTYKAAAAGLNFGGGKAVIIGNPDFDKSPELLRAFGRFVDDLSGQYITAADFGTSADDLDIVGEVTRHVVGRTARAGGSGDSGLATALGVYSAMAAAAERIWGSQGLSGRHVGVEGAGKVGLHLIEYLLEAGASVSVSDPSQVASRRVRSLFGSSVRPIQSVVDAPVEVYAPCALGATLTGRSVQTLQAQLVCGAANNQLATTSVDATLHKRLVTWVPDYIANAGGLIQVGGEQQGATSEKVFDDVRRIRATTHQLLSSAADANIPTGVAAANLVRRRLAEASAGSHPDK